MQTLRVARRSKLWSIRELAHRAGVNPLTVQHAEQGRPLKLETIRKLSAALGVDPLEIVEFRAAIEERPVSDD